MSHELTPSISFKQKVFIKTHGCQMNVNDSNRMLQLLSHEGYECTPSEEDADLIILNTCDIRERSEHKMHSELGRYKQLKDVDPSLVIAVSGCVAQVEKERILKQHKYVDLVFGPHQITELPTLLQSMRPGAPTSHTEFHKKESFEFARFFNNISGSVVESVTIMSGCNNFCTFCVVPYTRGREISRNFHEILDEIKRMTANGIREIMLLGQNVNSYEYTDPITHQKFGFADLLMHVNQIPDIQRIRFITSNPHDMTDDIVACFKSADKLENMIHFAVQSGSDRILKAMKRRHTAQEYMDVVNKLKTAKPGISISTDIIVGFPGETEDDFEQTLELMRKVRFSNIYAFIYSPRRNTKAKDFPDQIPLDIKKSRIYRLNDLYESIREELETEMVRQTHPVLVERVDAKNPRLLTGRTGNNKIVFFEGRTEWIGSLIPVTVTERQKHHLKGEAHVH